MILLLAVAAGCQNEGVKSGSSFPVTNSPPPDVAVTGTGPSFPMSAGALVAPLRIAATPSGWLLVTDPQRKAVLRVSPRTLTADKALELSDTPLGIAVLGDKIFVGLQQQQAIRIFSFSGAPMGFLAPPGTIAHPGDLAIDAGAGLVFALDGIAREVKVYRLAEGSGSLVGAVGTGQLPAPSGLAVDSQRKEVLVSDYGSTGNAASVRIFSYAPETQGALVATISGAGTCGMVGCSGGFSRPRGPAIHESRVYVPDVIHAQVLVFDRQTLQQVDTLGSGDPLISDLRMPSDVAVNAGGELFVTSTRTRSIVAFRGGSP